MSKRDDYRLGSIWLVQFDLSVEAAQLILKRYLRLC
jgi:hypothetical protein